MPRFVGTGQGGAESHAVPDWAHICARVTEKSGGSGACKPGSVPRPPARRRPGRAMAIRLRTPVAGRLVATNPGGGRKQPWGREAPARPYSVLLPVGFALPPPLPGARCALTAPFHPCPPAGEPAAGRFAFCGTFPGVAPAGRYPAPRFRGARTFLPRRMRRRRPSGRLTRHAECEAAGGPLTRAAL